MDEATIREIVRDEIAKALCAAEVDGPHMERIRRADAHRLRVEIQSEAAAATVAQVRQIIAQGVRPAGQRFRL